MSQGTTICTLKVLQDYSDADHCMTHRQILHYLKEDHHIDAERKKIARDLERLEDAGFEIHKAKNGKGCYLVRDFKDAELRFLIDYIISSKQVPEKQSKELIEKLFKLGGPSLEESCQLFCSSASEGISNNKSFFLNISDLADAIKKKNTVSFFYDQYGFDKQLHPIQEKPITVYPSDLVFQNGKYYLVAMPLAEKMSEQEDTTGEDASKKEWIYSEDARFFRLDRMRKLAVLTKSHRKVQKRFDDKHTSILKKHPFGFGGDVERVYVWIDLSLIDELIETFGKEFTYLGGVEKENLVAITLTAGQEDFLCWALQHAPLVDIRKPESLREMMIERLKTTSALYNVPIAEETKGTDLGERFLGLYDKYLDEDDEAFFEKYKNVESAELVNNDISDFSFLERFPNLCRLRLEEFDTFAEDLSVLTKLPYLEELALFNVVGRNTKFPIYDLPNLTRLSGYVDDFRDVDFRRLHQINPELKVLIEQDTGYYAGVVLTDEDWKSHKNWEVHFSIPSTSQRAAVLALIFGDRFDDVPDGYFEWLDKQESFDEVWNEITKDLKYNEKMAVLGYAAGKSVYELSDELMIPCESVSRFKAYALRRLRHPDKCRNLVQFMPKHSPFAEEYLKKHNDSL